MRICILNREYPPHGLVVGPAIFYETLARALAERGHRVHVICQGPGREGTRSEDGLTVHEVGVRTRRGDPLARIDYAVRAWLALRSIVREELIDVIDTQLFPAEGLLYSLRKGHAALLLEAHAWGEMMMYRGLRLNSLMRIETALERVAARRADLVVAPSEAALKHIVGVMAVPRERVVLMPVTSTVDTELFKPADSNIRERLGISADEPTVLCVGRLEARKGIHVLCEAMPLLHRKVPRVRFVLVGQDTDTAPSGGSFRQYVLARAQEHGLGERVRFLQNIPHSELVALYSACDLFVFPSLCENDGAPPLQAMACGRPVVATATSVSVDLCHGGSGIEIVPPDDPHRFAEGAVKLLSLSAAERAEVAAHNRRLVEERFSFTATVDRLLDAYAQAQKMARRRSSRGLVARQQGRQGGGG